MENSEIKKGSHFWAIRSDELLVMIKDIHGDCFVCGGWEGSVEDFKFIQYIEKPESHKNTKLYYDGI